METATEYDVFVSYAHADDGDGWVTALVDAIKQEHARFTPEPLRVFFDQEGIRAMDDWAHRILCGLRSAKVMLAVLSPTYFGNRYCRLEWEHYLEQELAHAMPGEGIAPIYTVTAPGFEGAEADAALEGWVADLRRRQYVDLRPWRPGGVEALQEEEVRRRLEQLDQQIAERVDRAQRAGGSPTTVPPHHQNFVGRVEELRRIRNMLTAG